jgi:hypothetical protein
MAEKLGVPVTAVNDLVQLRRSASSRRVRSCSPAPGVDISDVLALVNAVAWASERAASDPDLLDRLFALATAGLRG